MKPLIARKHLIIPILLISVLCLNGCALFYPKQIGENAASTTLDKLLAEVDTFIVETDSLKLVSGKLTQGALDSLLTPKTKAKLDSMLKALGVTADSTLDSIAAGFIAEILNDTAKKDVSEYVDELLDKLDQTASTVRDDLLGDTTREKLKELLNELLADSTTIRLQTIRDGVFDSTLHQYVVTLVDSAAAKGGDQIANKLARVLDEGKETGQGLLITFGVVVAGLLLLSWFLFRRGRNYETVSKMLTYQIHTMPDQKSYDELIKRIRSKSQEEDMESFLRKTLTHQGLLGAEVWSSPASAGTTTPSA